MNSRSSWCAPTPRCVVRARASPSGSASGTNISAAGWEKIIVPSFEDRAARHLGQARCCDRLTDAALRLFGQMKADSISELRRLAREHAARAFEDQGTARSGRDAAEQENVLELVEVGVVEEAVPEVHAHGLEDGARARVTALEQGLHLFQLRSGAHRFVERDAGARRPGRSPRLVRSSSPRSRDRPTTRRRPERLRRDRRARTRARSASP